MELRDTASAWHDKAVGWSPNTTKVRQTNQKTTQTKQKQLTLYETEPPLGQDRIDVTGPYTRDKPVAMVEKSVSHCH